MIIAVVLSISVIILALLKVYVSLNTMYLYLAIGLAYTVYQAKRDDLVNETEKEVAANIPVFVEAITAISVLIHMSLTTVGWWMSVIDDIRNYFDSECDDPECECKKRRKSKK
jgi:hypothetical protein